MKIRRSYILFFNQGLAIHHLKYSYSYQNIFQVLFTKNVDHYATTTKFIKIIPADPICITGMWEICLCGTLTKSTSLSQKWYFPEEIRSYMQIISSVEKCLKHWTALWTNKCNITKVTNSLYSFYVYVMNPEYLRTAGQRYNNSLNQ